MPPTCQPASPSYPAAGDAPTQIVRWEAAGGTWNVLSVTPTEASVALTSCGGTDIQEVIRSGDPNFVDWAKSRI